jgi:hypothetical protein
VCRARSTAFCIPCCCKLVPIRFKSLQDQLGDLSYRSPRCAYRVFFWSGKHIPDLQGERTGVVYRFLPKNCFFGGSSQCQNLRCADRLKSRAYLFRLFGERGWLSAHPTTLSLPATVPVHLPSWSLEKKNSSHQTTQAVRVVTSRDSPSDNPTSQTISCYTLTGNITALTNFQTWKGPSNAIAAHSPKATKDARSKHLNACGY